jgi:hypothetical protein
MVSTRELLAVSSQSEPAAVPKRARKPAAPKPVVVPFPAEWPADAATRDEQIALMTQEYDEHLARITEMVRQAREQQGRGKYCWSGFTDFVRAIGMSAVLPERHTGTTLDYGKAELPEKGYGNNYEDFSDLGLQHIRARRIDAWTEQMATARKQIISATRANYITDALMRKVFAQFGMKLPERVTRVSVSMGFTLPADTTETPATLRRKLNAAVEEAMADLAWIPETETGVHTVRTTSE